MNSTAWDAWRLSLTGFLVAGLFLSRKYALTLFLLGGVGKAGFDIGLRRGWLIHACR